MRTAPAGSCFCTDEVTGNVYTKEEIDEALGTGSREAARALVRAGGSGGDMERRWLGSPQGMEGKAEAGTGAWPMRVIWWWSAWGRRIRMAFPGPHR